MTAARRYLDRSPRARNGGRRREAAGHGTGDLPPQYHGAPPFGGGQQLPAMVLEPKSRNKQVVIWISKEGKQSLLDEAGPRKSRSAACWQRA